MFENKTDHEINNHLPLGSVIYITDSADKLMIVGRQIIPDESNSDVVFDYCGCRLPHGVDPKSVYFFNATDIGEVLFEGYRDDDENRMENLIESKLDEKNLD